MAASVWREISSAYQAKSGARRHQRRRWLKRKRPYRRQKANSNNGNGIRRRTSRRIAHQMRQIDGQCACACAASQRRARRRRNISSASSVTGDRIGGAGGGVAYQRAQNQQAWLAIAGASYRKKPARQVTSKQRRVAAATISARNNQATMRRTNGATLAIERRSA